MKRATLAATCLLLSSCSTAPDLQDDPPGFAMWTSSELARRDTALSTRVGEDHSARETLADYGNPTGANRFRFILRDADGNPEEHEEIEDVVFIQSGEGTLLVGGELINRRGGSTGTYSGDGIAGGTRYPVGPGDLIHIPAKTPHSYLVPEGGHITYVLVRVQAFTGEAVVSADTRPIQDDPTGFAMWKASELAQRDAALSTRVGEDHSARETLADYHNPTRAHRFRLILRDADGNPEEHVEVEDVVFIQSGEGTLLVGGELINRRGGSTGTYSGDGIAGGSRYPIGPGDLIRIPAKTPHSFLTPDGGHITYVLAKVPEFVGEAL
jgi:mannose-6-phosphate isomerase-like protein (cupin superfamily)